MYTLELALFLCPLARVSPQIQQSRSHLVIADVNHPLADVRGLGGRPVLSFEEVRRGEDESAQAHDQHAEADPARLRGFRPSPEEADWHQAEEGGDVVGTGYQAALGAPETEPLLDGGYHHVHETVDQHAWPRRRVKVFGGFWSLLFIFGVYDDKYQVYKLLRNCFLKQTLFFRDKMRAWLMVYMIKYIGNIQTVPYFS